MDGLLHPGPSQDHFKRFKKQIFLLKSGTVWPVRRDIIDITMYYFPYELPSGATRYFTLTLCQSGYCI